MATTTNLKTVDAYMSQIGREGWVYVLLGMIDEYRGEEDKTCLSKYNDFWNVLVEKMNFQGHGLKRDAFIKLVDMGA